LFVFFFGLLVSHSILPSGQSSNELMVNSRVVDAHDACDLYGIGIAFVVNTNCNF
jgi:hypothetical protein